MCKQATHLASPEAPPTLTFANEIMQFSAGFALLPFVFSLQLFESRLANHQPAHKKSQNPAMSALFQKLQGPNLGQQGESHFPHSGWPFTPQN